MTSSRLRRTISRWANPHEAEAQQLRAEHTRTTGTGSISVADAPDREKVTLRGTISTVTLRPRAGVPALEAELNDGTGVVTVVWLGRRRIAGVEPGRRVMARGRVGVHNGRLAIYNPWYELLPAGTVTADGESKSA